MYESSPKGLLANILEKLKRKPDRMAEKLDQRLESWHDFVNGQLIRIEGFGEPRGILQKLKDDIINPQPIQRELQEAQQMLLEHYLNTANKFLISLRLRLGERKTEKS